MVNTERLYYVVFFLCVIYLLLRLHARFLQRRQRQQRNRTRSRRRSILNASNEFPSPPVMNGNEREAGQEIDIGQEREDRRALILTSVVVKKAVVHEAETEDDSPQDGENTKDNIFIRSFRNGLAFVNDLSTNSLHDPKVCTICLEPYKENEEICWSKNEKCSHSFHLDCMTNWLMDHDDCPICRSEYLQEHSTGDASV